MPFTASHPAAVLPLQRVGAPVSALVIGSLVPDLPYFLPVAPSAAQTHTLGGVLGANLLLGLAVFVVWHLWLAPPLLWAAPEDLQRRIPESLRGGLADRLTTTADLVRVCVGLALGGLTHIVWDAFTHAGMWGPRTFPWLSTPVFGLELFRWLQHVSTLVGLAVVGWYLLRWWRSAPLDGPAAPIPLRASWTPVAAMACFAAASAISTAVGVAAAPGRVSREGMAIEATVTFLGTATAGLLLAATLWHVLAGTLRSDR